MRTFHRVCSFLLLALVWESSSAAARTDKEIGAHSAAATAQQRGGDSAWTVSDSIAVRYFKSPDGWDSGRVLLLSPDARHFLVMTTYGDLVADRVINELYVFSVPAVKAALAGAARAPPPPVRRLRVESSRVNELDQPIQQIKWDGNDSIVFSGTRQNNDYAVYRFSLLSGELQRLSGDDHCLTYVDDLSMLGLARGVTVYAAQDMKNFGTSEIALTRYPFSEVTGTGIQEFLGNLYPWRPLTSVQLFVGIDGRQPKPVMRLERTSRLLGAWIERSHHYAIAAVAPLTPESPAQWSSYEEKLTHDWYRYVLIDLDKGTSMPVFDAPAGRSATRIGNSSSLGFSALWSHDGTSVVLVNTALPLSDEKNQRREMSYLVDYSVAEGKWSEIEPLKTGDVEIDSVGWLEEGRRFLVTRKARDGARRPGTIYTFDGSGWRAQHAGAAAVLPKVAEPMLSGGLSLTLTQGANDPPKLVATLKKRALDLLGPDPALKDKALARVETVSWQEPHGERIYGGLLLPRNAAPGKPLPLVIHAYEFRPDSFQPDGPFSNTAFAAQAVVSRGMAALVMDIPWIVDSPGQLEKKPYLKHWRTWNDPQNSQELQIFMENLDAAVASLAERGVIDPNRVGLVGFSRSGYLTYYAVTHPGRTKLAAAITADCFTGSYADLTTAAAFADDSDGAAASVRGIVEKYKGNFWQNKAGWLDKAPMFNVERVTTPMLFSTAGIGDFSDMLETIGAWRLNRRPFEYLMFPDAGHQVFMPRERYELMRATVEWMDFWLQGTPPEDAARRARWSKMAAEWAETQKGMAADVDSAAPPTQSGGRS